MLYVVGRGTLGLTSGMGTAYFAGSLEGIEMLLGMFPERLLPVKDPCSIFEVESFIADAEDALQAVTLHGHSTVSRCHGLCR